MSDISSDRVFAPSVSAPVHVPAFARIDEYAGVWIIEPGAATNLWNIAQRTNFTEHMAAYKNRAAQEMPSNVEMVESNGKNIALIKAQGVLMKSSSSFGGTSTIQLRRDIRGAVADSEVDGIILAIDSPGGTVSGTADLATDIKAASRKKLVWAHIEDMGASAAYWLASQTSRITANNATAMIGSIGTYTVVQDASALYEREGIKTYLFATGPLKGLGVQGTKVTEEQQAHVQDLVNSLQESFDEAVQKGRGLSKTELAAVRHGGVFVATKALGAKLIDGIAPLSKVVGEMSTALKAMEPGSSGKKVAAETTDKVQASAVLPMLRRSLPSQVS